MKSSWICLFLMCLCGCPMTEETCDRSTAACMNPDMTMSMTNPDQGGSIDLAVPDGGMLGPAPACSADGWCWRNPLPQGNRLTGVSGIAPNNVWAVGLFETISKLN